MKTKGRRESSNIDDQRLPPTPRPVRSSLHGTGHGGPMTFPQRSPTPTPTPGTGGNVSRSIPRLDPAGPTNKK